jgi:hypothetical protein
MGLFELFKSRKEREKEFRKKLSRALRAAEGAVSDIKGLIDKTKKEKGAKWQEASGYLKAGRKDMAMRSMKSVHAAYVTIEQLERKNWVFEQLNLKFSVAVSSGDFISALEDLALFLNVDPDHLEDVLEDVQETLGDQSEVDKIWDKMHDREMGSIEACGAGIPDLDTMMQELECDVAAEIAGSYRICSDGSSQSFDAAAKAKAKAIDEGRKRLDELIRGRKK